MRDCSQKRQMPVSLSSKRVKTQGWGRVGIRKYREGDLKGKRSPGGRVLILCCPLVGRKGNKCLSRETGRLVRQEEATR